MEKTICSAWRRQTWTTEGPAPVACNPVFVSLDRKDQAVPADEGDAWNTSTLKRGAGTGGRGYWATSLSFADGNGTALVKRLQVSTVREKCQVTNERQGASRRFYSQ